MPKRLSRVFRVAMPILQASLIRQILVGLVLGAALAYLWPAAAKEVGLLGSIFVTALKGVAPILVFVSSRARSPTSRSQPKCTSVL